MEFKSFKNIESSFRQIRLLALVFLGICAFTDYVCHLKVLPLC